MKKLMLISLTILGMLMLAAPRTAVAVNIDQTYTLKAGALTVSNTATFYRVGAPVESITLKNNATFSNAVTIVQYDAGVAGATLYSGTLTAGAGATVYPVRTVSDGNTTNRPYIICGLMITITSASGATNAVDGSVETFIQSGRMNPQ